MRNAVREACPPGVWRAESWPGEDAISRQPSAISDAPVCRFRDTDSNGTLDETLYYCQDANMNVTALVAASDGAVVERYMYDPYGKASVRHGVRDAQGTPTTEWQERTSNTFQNEVLCAGYRLDSETGLCQRACPEPRRRVRRRYYHATLGRWLSRDPAGYQDGMNLYEYCRSGPVGATDAMGIQAEAVSDEGLSLDVRIAYLQRQKEQWHEEYELAREQGNAEAAENFQYMIVHCGRLQVELKERRAGVEVGAFEAARRNYLRAGGSEEGYLIDTEVRYWLGLAGIDANVETYLWLEKMEVDKRLAAFLGAASGLAKLHGLEALGELVTGENLSAHRQNIIYDRQDPTNLGPVARGLCGVEAALRLWGYFVIVKPRPMQETGRGWIAKHEGIREVKGSFTYGPKISRQMQSRGWTDAMIDETVSSPAARSGAFNKATGEQATAFFRPDGSYVVRTDASLEIIQVSNRLDPKWVPDSSIKQPYSPGGKN